MHRGLTSHIDLEAISMNYSTLRAACGVPVYAVVKADAYGHGAVEVSRSLLASGVAMLAVAWVGEAEELREAGIEAPMLVLFDRTEVERYFELSLTPVIHDIETARAFAAEALGRNCRIDVHVKVDTGMGRMGVDDTSCLDELLTLGGIRVTGIMSHLSDADADDKEFTLIQVKRLNDIRKRYGLADVTCHLANSAAALSVDASHMDAVRPGLALYGISPFQDGASAHGLRPAMKVTAPVLTLRRVRKGSSIGYGRTYIAKRDTLCAVLAAGYADGFSRSFSNRASVLLCGGRAPVLGRVSMDLTVVDATGIDAAREGMHAVLLGRDGAQEITAWDVAANADTIPYEPLIWFGNHSTRTYGAA